MSFSCLFFCRSFPVPKTLKQGQFVLERKLASCLCGLGCKLFGEFQDITTLHWSCLGVRRPCVIGFEHGSALRDSGARLKLLGQ